MAQLVRYQVYLEPQLVAAADDVARRSGGSRAKILRAALAKYIGQKRKTGKNPLLKLSGIERSKTGRVSENVDEIYLHD